MHLALPHRLLPRVRRVLLLAVAPLLLAGLLVATAGSAPLAAAAGSGAVDISAGGPAAAPFVADEDFAGGAVASVTNAISTTGVTNPAPQSVYQHNRYGNFTYTVPGFTAGASYTVRLHFAEEYWTAAGSRVFNVSIDGTQVLTNFDIFAAAGGEYKAVVEQFTETAPSSGTFTIQFSTVKDNAQVNGIEIDPAGSSTGNTVTVTAPGNQAGTVGTAASLQIAASDSASGQTLTYAATGLPAGLSVNSATGLITGTPTTAGTSTVTVTAADTTGASGSATFTWTVSSGPGTGGVDISAGGPAAAPYLADEDFTGGATSDTTHAITTTGLSDPAPQSVYQHNRYGNFTYTVPGLTAGGSYTVRLHFAEEYWTTAGSRTFNVLINGTQVLTGFDIFAAAGGEYIAVIEPFTATASSTGTITIQFVTVKDNAQVNGIEIIPAGSTGANTVTVTAPGNQAGTVGTAASLQITASDSASGQTLTYTATGLPAGLAVNSATGLITGTPTTAGTSTVTVTATDTTGAAAQTTFTWTINPATTGTGEPPAAFWGNTSAIPAATNVLEVSIVNQTNGQYPDSEVYWSFNGQTESIAQQPYIDMPANSAGRMYFYLGTPNGPYYDFIEFTVGTSSINVDTTRVDRFGLKLALLLHGHDGSNQEVGEDYATFQESRAATFQRELRAHRVQGTRHRRRPLRHPVTGQRPRVPDRRRLRELLQRLCGGQW
jgi:beta-galactosidase